MKFLFTFRQLVDAWRKFVNRASKVKMLRNNRNSRLQENLCILKQSPTCKLDCYLHSRFCEKMGVTRVPPGILSRTTGGTRTTGWDPCIKISNKTQ